MKHLFISFCTFLLPFSCCAFESLAQVRTSNGLELIVFGESGGASLKSGERIVYTFVSTNRWTLVVPKSEYFCAARLTTTNGTRIPETRLGESLGKDFFRLNDFSRDLVERSLSHPAQLQKLTVNGTNGSGGSFWHRPNEMFQVTRAGSNVLELRVQVFGRNVGVSSTNYIVERFPLIKIPVDAMK